MRVFLRDGGVIYASSITRNDSIFEIVSAWGGSPIRIDASLISEIHVI